MFEIKIKYLFYLGKKKKNDKISETFQKVFKICSLTFFYYPSIIKTTYKYVLDLRNVIQNFTTYNETFT